MQWREIQQEVIGELWKGSCCKMKEDVLEKYEADPSKRGPYRGRGQHLAWHIQVRTTKHKHNNGEDCLLRAFPWFREYTLQTKHALRAGLITLEEELKQQVRMRVVKGIIKRIKKSWNGERSKQLVGHRTVSS